MLFKYSRLLFLTTVFTASVHCSDQNNTQTINQLRLIVDKKGHPSPVLKELLEKCGIQHDGTLKTIVEQTQKAFLRPADKERWEIGWETKLNPETANNLFDKLGLIKEVKPSDQQYDYALLMGAIASTVRTRLNYLATLFKNGIHFKKIIFLGGARPLDTELESEFILYNPDVTRYPLNPAWQKPSKLPKTEIEMMRMLYEQMDLSSEFRAIPVRFIDTPMQQNPNGTIRRPNTADTIKEWLTTKPKHGSVLVISNQPYIGYQDVIVRTFLPSEFKIDSAGSASKQKKQTIYFDSIARWLYQEEFLTKKQS